MAKRPQSNNRRARKMCGIAGIVNMGETSVGTDKINQMLFSIKHRGPDDEGIYIKNNVGLGHVRLSIIDLSSAGHQPMTSKDERYIIVFNGEIYNYLELKKELENSYQFISKTDTEVLLAAYITWGEDCLDQLNGDFAFVIYDSQEQTLFGARDRFGIKPFYYYKNNEHFIFASEIKALLPLIPACVPNEKAIFEYLLYNRTDQSDETFFDTVLKLKHGHCFTIKGSELKVRKWYDLSSKIKTNIAITPEQYREQLKKSIGLRLRSDVPIGVCLSGGIDSSTITSVLYHDFKINDLKTFSAVFEKGHSADESPFVDLYRGTIPTMHTVTPSAESFYADFNDFIVSQCEPMPSVSPYAQYKVMKLVKDKVSVTLDGQGADEMLAGYTYFYGSFFKELLKGFKLIKLSKEIGAYLKNAPTWEAFSYFLYYLLPIWLKHFIGRKTFGSLDKKFYKKYIHQSTLSSDLYNPETLNDSFLQHFEYKLEHLLKWDDLNSMSFSLESRIPFLDHNLVELTLSLRSDLIINSGVSKWILRESVKDILPSKIYNRKDKKGFETPSDEWFRTVFFQKYINELLDSPRFKNRGYFDVKSCKQKYKKHLERKANLSKDIWKWINLEIWFQHFIDPKKD